MERIFEWTAAHGTAALDKQLKAKYKESLTEFIEEYSKLSQELYEFYSAVDKKMLVGMPSPMGGIGAGKKRRL